MFEHKIVIVSFLLYHSIMSYSSVGLSLFDKLSGVSFAKHCSTTLSHTYNLPSPQIREILSFPALLSVSEDDAVLQNVYSVQTSLQGALDFDNSEVSIANLEAEFDTTLSDTGSDLAKILLDRYASRISICLHVHVHIFVTFVSVFQFRRVTHADIRVTEEEDKLRATFQVYYHYLELEPVGQMIDGDLVVQGLSIRENFGPAFCTLEYAATSSDVFTEIGTVGPWSFMLTASEGDAATGDMAHKAAQFMIPISVPDEYQKGSIRVLIYVDQADKVPYDEEPLTEQGECAYDMKSAALREATICAVSLIKQSTATESGAGSSEKNTEGVSESEFNEGTDETGSRRSPEGGSPSPPFGTEGEEVVETVRSAHSEVTDNEVTALLEGTKLEEIDTARHSHTGMGSKRESFLDPAIASEALLLEQAQGVIADIRIASDYDDVLALQAEGYELHCTHVGSEGPLSGQEHLWKFHVMSRYGNTMWCFLIF